jgi:tetratricopeptide (TPR) repeat protein
MRPFVRHLAVWCVLSVVALASRDAHATLRGAREALTRGDYALCETELTRGVRANERAQAERVRAQLQIETGRYDDALATGVRLARLAGMRAVGLTVQGEALAARGNDTDAIARWEQCLAAGTTPATWRARALLATWLFRLGRRDEAREAATALIDAYNDASEAEENGTTPAARARAAMLRDPEFLTYVAMAARALGAVRNANQALNEALRIDATRVESNLEQAELMLSTEDMRPAGEALRAALGTNPHSARALVLRARIRLQSNLDFTRAGDDLTAALAVNPRLASAYALRAAIVLRDGAIAEADRLLDQGAAIDARDLDVLTMRGVVRYVANDNDGLRRAFDALFAVSPTYAAAYEAVSDFADWEHRYDEAIALMREGLARPSIAADRRLGARIRASLGTNLLRMGREAEGIAELRTSFEASRFNVRVANLLNLYEQTMEREYVTETDGPFRFRYHRDERAVLARYVPSLMRTAWNDMVQRYGFTPEGPISIELYATDEHFSVRTSGLPEIGVQGVCFGRVVTALSPRGGPFNWAQILWHELGHVFAIQRSRSRVPRWFTEGLSEWEAFHSHPNWSREDDPELARALAAGRVPRVADFNTAFTHARAPSDMLMAYYAASRLVEFMIDRYTFARVAAMLPLWGQGLATPDVIQRALGVSADEVDRGFRDALRPRLARYATQYVFDPSAWRERAPFARAVADNPQSAETQEQAAAAALVAGDAETATQHAERAVRLDSNARLARWVRVTLALARRRGAEALTEIDDLVRTGADGYEIRIMEARAARLAHDDARLERALTAAVRFDATQVDAHRALAELYTRTHRDTDRLRALREVVRLDQHDREALGSLLEALTAARAWTDIGALTEHANHLDPENVAVHFALAHAAYERGDVNTAVFEYESALTLDVPDATAVRARITAVRAGQRGLPPLTVPRRTQARSDVGVEASP